MASEDSVEYDNDLESPKSIDLSEVIKADDESVATHQSDSDSETHHSAGYPHHGNMWRKLFFVAILAAILGLSVGLGVGLRMGGEESTRTVEKAALTGDAANTPPASSNSSNGAVPTTVEEGAYVEEPAAEDSDYSTDFDPEPTTEAEAKAAPTGMIIGVGSFSSENVAWPELLGLPAEEAKNYIEGLNEGYDVIIVGPGEPTTKDLREDRVFLFTNEEGLVDRVPRPFR